MKSKKRPKRSRAGDGNSDTLSSLNISGTGSSTERETTLRFYLPKDLAVKAWNMAALEKLSFNAYVLKLLVEDAARLREEEAKVLKFPKGHRGGGSLP